MAKSRRAITANIVKMAIMAVMAHIVMARLSVFMGFLNTATMQIFGQNGFKYACCKKLRSKQIYLQ